MKRVVIIGASGHGKVLADTIQKSGDQVLGFLDDNPNLDDEFCGMPVLGKVTDWKKYTNEAFVIAIGNPEIRERISHEIEGEFYTAIHPSAQISGIDVEIGQGTVVMANAVVNSGAHIGRHVIINTSAVVEHDNQINDYVHISVGTKLAGTVSVGKKSWIGIGACVSNNISICDNCMIGAGAVVVDNITEAGTYVGIPARRIK